MDFSPVTILGSLVNGHHHYEMLFQRGDSSHAYQAAMVNAKATEIQFVDYELESRSVATIRLRQDGGLFSSKPVYFIEAGSRIGAMTLFLSGLGKLVVEWDQVNGSLLLPLNTRDNRIEELGVDYQLSLAGVSALVHRKEVNILGAMIILYMAWFQVRRAWEI